ncbi:hypothetical protein JCM19000A_21990 [Silvimonas sp. JCM 19000]
MQAKSIVVSMVATALLLAFSVDAKAWVAGRTVVGPNGGVVHSGAAGVAPVRPPPPPPGYRPPPPPPPGYYGHPVATAAAVTATVAVTAAVVGSIVHSIPPSCTAVIVNGLTYQQCGSTWYQPQYVGTSVQYVVINPPR